MQVCKYASRQASKQARSGDDLTSGNASFAGKGVESLPGVAAEYVPKGAKSSDSGVGLAMPQSRLVARKRAKAIKKEASLAGLTRRSRL
jgi:hypothetical protein